VNHRQDILDYHDLYFSFMNNVCSQTKSAAFASFFAVAADTLHLLHHWFQKFEQKLITTCQKNRT